MYVYTLTDIFEPLFRLACEMASLPLVISDHKRPELDLLLQAQF